MTPDQLPTIAEPLKPYVAPCPFCGNDDSRVVHYGHTGSRVWVYCNVCECEGPASGRGEADAIRLWNERAGSAEIATLRADLAECRRDLSSVERQARGFHETIGALLADAARLAQDGPA